MLNEKDLELMQTGLFLGLKESAKNINSKANVETMKLDTKLNLIFKDERVLSDDHIEFLNFMSEMVIYLNEVLEGRLKSKITLDFLPEETKEKFKTLEDLFDYFGKKINDNIK